MKFLSFIISLLLFAISAKASPTWYPLPTEAYKFGQLYPKAQQLLFAFDYGHALVYERLLQNRGQIMNPKDFEKKVLTDVMMILKNPPNVKVDEGDIAPQYVFTLPLMVDTFDWSHMLHHHDL